MIGFWIMSMGFVVEGFGLPRCARNDGKKDARNDVKKGVAVTYKKAFVMTRMGCEYG